jgi:hypothetical protein
MRNALCGNSEGKRKGGEDKRSPRIFPDPRTAMAYKCLQLHFLTLVKKGQGRRQYEKNGVRGRRRRQIES